MSSTPGSPDQIGHYPIEREIGRGGMGIVYLARDPKLDRPVAIKVLPDLLASDPERLARFEREARLLASLNHPNIAGIYGLEESEGQRFLALEYVEGETLSARLAKGPMPLDDAVDVCRQIAAALEAAHDNGVIHRDLKPGNVMLTAAGEAKVLDFGLAKSGDPASGASDPNISQSPTMAVTAATGVGVVLGTAAYMSPEQARGKAVDRRTDIWSFGCVLYECLTGRQVFAGETISDIVALILQGGPNWDALPSDVPPRVRELLERCFEKDAKKRLRDIGEARLMLEGDVTASISGVRADAIVEVGEKPRPAWPGYALAAVFAVATAALAALLLSGRESAPTMRLVIPDPAGVSRPAEPAHMAISPDGTQMVTVAADSTGAVSLWLRSLASTQSRELPGTKGGILPFWSPDSRYIGFVTEERLHKIDTRGGNPETLGPLRSYGRGSSWGSQGDIVFCAGGSGPLYKISENGGDPVQLTELDSTETAHRFPHFLPDGRHFLFASLPPKGDQYDIYIGSIEGPKRELLMTASGVPHYAEPGLLLYLRNGRIVAHAFDAASRRLGDEVVALPDQPDPGEWLGFRGFHASLSGALTYVQTPPAISELVWFDDRGRILETVPVPAANYEAIDVSPDGQRAVVVKRTSLTESELWIVEFARGSMTRLTFGKGRVDYPLWSPDGRRVAFSSDRGNQWDIYVKTVGSSEKAEPVLVGGSILKNPTSWTPDGRALMYNTLEEETSWDLWVLPLEGDRTPRPYARSPFQESDGSISPNGKWVVYYSTESGRNEVYVQAFPNPGPKHQVSTSGGLYPQWQRDGRRIAYRSAGLTLVDIVADDAFAIGAARVLPWGRNLQWPSMAPDGRILAVRQSQSASRLGVVMVVLNWRSELESR